MGRINTTGKNLMVDALTTAVTHVGLLARTEIAGTTGAASTNTFSKDAHGMADGTPVLLTELTGGTGLTAGSAGNADDGAQVYFVRDTATDTFKLAASIGGTAVEFSTDVTEVTVNSLAEVSGGSYARLEDTYSGTASAGEDDLASSLAFDVPACTVGAVGAYTALESGTQHAIDGVIFETYASAGTYTLSAAPITISDS